MAEKTLTLIGQMDKVWMDECARLVERGDGTPVCEMPMRVRVAAMEVVLRFVKAQRPKTSEQTRVAVIGHLRTMEKELKREIVNGGGYDDWFWKIAREFERPLGVVMEEGVKKAADVICDSIGIHDLVQVARRALKAAGIRLTQETIEGVYHREDASGTDRIETESRPYFLDISDEYDGKRIAVHIEVLED